RLGLLTCGEVVRLAKQGRGARCQEPAQLRQLLFARGRPAASVLQAGLDILLHADLRDSVRSLATPALIIHGSFDQLAPVCAAEWLAQALPNTQLAVITGASHAPFLSHRAQFDRVLIPFLESI
ncbi:MAG: hypothetical protein ABL868_09350, partial [Sulfuriferula sp.]